MIDKLNNEISPELYEIIHQKAIVYARSQGRSSIQPKDLALSFFGKENIPVVDLIIKKFEAEKEDIFKELMSVKVKVKAAKKDQLLDTTASYLLQSADRIVTHLQHPFISIEHVVLAFIEYSGKSESIKQIKNILRKFGMTGISFRRSIIENKKEAYNLLDEIFKEGKPKINNKRTFNDNEKTHSTDERDQKIKESLMGYGFIDNLNEIVKTNKESFVGRETETERCIRVLLRKKKRNVIIVGETGTGKTALVEGLATKINEGNVPNRIKGAVIYSVHLGNIIAGTKFRGQFEERMKNVIGFIEKESKEKNVIIFFDEIHTICNTGSAEGAINASSILKPVLSKGVVQCIGTTTLEDYRKHILPDSALSRRFSNVFLEEPQVEEVVEMMKFIKKEYEEYYKISISNEIVEYIVEVSDKYIKNKNFPDKAIDILDESCSKLISDESGNAELNKEIIADIISEMTGVPITTVCGEEKKTLKILEENLSSFIIGQNSAIQKVSNSIKRARLGLKDPEKPIGVFLFLGPTGTGKTLLSKTLAENLFGKNRIIRLDMSEYMDKTSVNKLTGSAPGYVGYDDGSRFAEEIRKRPYSVLLLDEIEKAHPDVQNVFLQIFDEGRMTDSLGRLVDFRNVIVIMTSNLATSELANHRKMGFMENNTADDPKAAEEFLREKTEKFFRPEFLNRLDDIIIFNKILESQMPDIFDIEFDKLKKRLLKIGYEIDVDENVKTFLCKEGYSEKYGARPIIRAIQKHVETPLANEFFNDAISPGDKILASFNTESKKIIFNGKKN